MEIGIFFILLYNNNYFHVLLILYVNTYLYKNGDQENSKYISDKACL